MQYTKHIHLSNPPKSQTKKHQPLDPSSFQWSFDSTVVSPHNSSRWVFPMHRIDGGSRAIRSCMGSIWSRLGLSLGLRLWTLWMQLVLLVSLDSRVRLSASVVGFVWCYKFKVRVEWQTFVVRWETIATIWNIEWMDAWMNEWMVLSYLSFGTPDSLRKCNMSWHISLCFWLASSRVVIWPKRSEEVSTFASGYFCAAGVETDWVHTFNDDRISKSIHSAFEN